MPGKDVALTLLTPERPLHHAGEFPDGEPGKLLRPEREQPIGERLGHLEPRIEVILGEGVELCYEPIALVPFPEAPLSLGFRFGSFTNPAATMASTMAS